MRSHKKEVEKWALILGASSGIGGATSVTLAKHGYNIFGVHLDRQVTMPVVKNTIREIEKAGKESVFFNINAADAIKRQETLDDITEHLTNSGGGSVKVLVHSLAFGTLKPFLSKNPTEAISQAQMEMTLDVMANSLVYWTQGLISRGLLTQGGRIFALTSAGSQTVIPSYGAVSAAKSALESHIRQLAFELGPLQITANAIRAGVTDTPALHKIPGAKNMLDLSRLKNPRGRTTQPLDVSNAIAALCSDDCDWISGNVIGVDGGENIVSFVSEKNLHLIK